MKLTDRELATVLAALRFWQAEMVNAYESCEADDWPSSIPVVDKGGHFREHKPLTPDEIDGLCERLNSVENTEAFRTMQAIRKQGKGGAS